MTYVYPALSWLIKHDSEAALVIFHRLRDDYYTHGDAPLPSRCDPNPDDLETHSVPEEAITGDSMCEAAQDGPDDVHQELLHEIRPSVDDMLRSAGGIAWPWCGRRVKEGGKWKWVGEAWAYEYSAVPVVDGDMITLNGLAFYMRPKARRRVEGGLLLHFINDKGRVERPTYKAMKPRGGKRPYRKSASGYLALPGAVDSPLTASHCHRPFSGQPAIADAYDPLPRREPSEQNRLGRYGAKEARDLLKVFGVDGSVGFADLPVKATFLPDGIAKQARFIGGISGRSQTASPAGPKWNETDGGALEPVLEEVAARGTLESIGVKLGYQGGYADRAGGKALLAVGKALVAANDNAAKKVAA